MIRRTSHMKNYDSTTLN